MARRFTRNRAATASHRTANTARANSPGLTDGPPDSAIGMPPRLHIGFGNCIAAPLAGRSRPRSCNTRPPLHGRQPPIEVAGLTTPVVCPKTGPVAACPQARVVARGRAGPRRDWTRNLHPKGRKNMFSKKLETWIGLAGLTVALAGCGDDSGDNNTTDATPMTTTGTQDTDPGTTTDAATDEESTAAPGDDTTTTGAATCDPPCAANEECIEGICFPTGECDPACAAGEECVDGTCMTPPADSSDYGPCNACAPARLRPGSWMLMDVSVRRHAAPGTRVRHPPRGRPRPCVRWRIPIRGIFRACWCVIRTVTTVLRAQPASRSWALVFAPIPRDRAGNSDAQEKGAGRQACSLAPGFLSADYD